MSFRVATFTYTISDGHGGTSMATVTLIDPDQRVFNTSGATRRRISMADFPATSSGKATLPTTVMCGNGA